VREREKWREVMLRRIQNKCVWVSRNEQFQVITLLVCESWVGMLACFLLFTWQLKLSMMKMIKQFWMFSRYFDFFFRELIPWRRRVLIFYTLSSILKLFGIVLAISFSLAIWNFSNATFLRTSNFEGTSIISDIEHTHKYLWFPASEFRQPVNHRYPILFFYF